MDEDVFRALADPSRRALLDALRERDGQALSELEASLPTMTRFGVMKHLRVLADAGLVTAHRDGRRKLHYLNPVPIRLIHDRWISRFAEPLVGAIAGLKTTLEAAMTDTEKHVYEIYVKTSPERLWEAITSDEMRRRYSFGVGVSSDWTPGSRFEARHPMSARPITAGENLEVDPPRRLVQSYTAMWSDEVEAEGASRVTWEVEQVGDSCRLLVTHDQLREGASEEIYGGWPMVLSGLKTLLETGETLTTPGSLMYSQQPESVA